VSGGAYSYEQGGVEGLYKEHKFWRNLGFHYYVG